MKRSRRTQENGLRSRIGQQEEQNERLCDGIGRGHHQQPLYYF